MAHFVLTRIIHESAASTADMGVLPGVLRSRTLRRTIKVRLGCEPLRLPGGKPIFTVSRHQLVNYPGLMLHLTQKSYGPGLRSMAWVETAGGSSQ